MIDPSRKNYAFGYVPVTYIPPIEINDCFVHHARAWMPPNRPFDWLVDCPLSVGEDYVREPIPAPVDYVDITFPNGRRSIG